MLVPFCYISKNMFCLKSSDEYLLPNNSYGSLLNDMLYSESNMFINMRLTIPVAAMKPCVQQNDLGTCLKKSSSLFSR